MCVSLIGTWMQNTAQPWLAYSLTNSPLLLSLVGVCQFLPMLLFSLFAGVIIDRFPKKKILLVTQSSALAVALCLALLIWSGRVQYWHLLVAALIEGCVNTLDMPTRQSFVIELVGRDDLMNAIALNSAVFNIARVLGPGIAGVVMARYGTAVCFYINAFSFAAVVTALLFLKPVPVAAAVRRGESILRNIGEGLRYIAGKPTLYRTLLTVLVTATFAMNYNVLMPVFSKNVLDQGEAGYGFLMSFMGVGSLFGAISVAAGSRNGPKGKILRWFPVCIGFCLLAVGATRIYGLTALAMAVAGFFFVSFSATANSTIQYETDNEHRGRVMSVYNMAFSGTTPIGNLFVGVISDRAGAPAALYASGAAVLLLIAGLFRRSKKHAAGSGGGENGGQLPD